MTNPIPIPDELRVKVPPDAQAAIAAAFFTMKQRMAELEARLCDLEARLKLNSTNSSKPPSSDPVGMKRKPPKPPSKRRRGGQPGRRKAHRVLVPPGQVAETIHCKPASCRRCGHDLVGEDLEPLVHQVAELPKIHPSSPIIASIAWPANAVEQPHAAPCLMGFPPAASVPICRPSWPCGLAHSAVGNDRSSRSSATPSACVSTRAWSPSSSGDRARRWKPFPSPNSCRVPSLCALLLVAADEMLKL